MVFLFELNGRTVTGFDTGLDSRAFARAKLAQILTESGIVVDSGHAEPWRPSGVVERAADEKSAPTMVVWGPAFEGERLDLIVNDDDRRDEALSAVALWLRAVLALGDKDRVSAPLWPCAAIIAAGAESRVFFAPPTLALRCLRANDEALRYGGYEWYVHPDLGGAELVRYQNDVALPAHLVARGALGGHAKAQLDAELSRANARTAFTAAAMLYRIVSGAPPFPATNDITLHQDVREGNFLPTRLAVPGLDARFADLVQRALEPRPKKNAPNARKKPLPGELLEAIPPAGKSGDAAAGANPLVTPLSEADALALEKEKAQYVKAKSASVNAKRFVARNAGALIAGVAAAAVVALLVGAVAGARAARPTTAGMEPLEVVESYFNAFGELDHHLMDNIVLRRVGRSDVNMVVNLFVVNRVRMAHEGRPAFISARQWKEMGGGQTEFSVFGVTDLNIEQIRQAERFVERESGRGRRDEELRFRVEYVFWMPMHMAGGSENMMDPRLRMENAPPPPPVPFRHVDLVTLVLRNGNWRISDIARVARY